MARTISWLPRLKEIRVLVEKSPISLWDRADLEKVFELQSRAANTLLAKLPRGRGPGGALLVEREALLRFLNEVERTGRPPKARTKVYRKRMRLTVLPARQVGRGSVEAIPNTVTVAPGRISVAFRDAEDLIAQMWTLALAARDDEERFRGLVAPGEPARKPQEKESAAIERDIREREAEYARRKAS